MMRTGPARLLLLLLCQPIFTGAGPAMALAIPGSHPGGLVPAALGHLGTSLALVLVALLGLYAYASLARLAPYQSWIYLYLVSLTGIAWALFLVNDGTFPPDSIFILVTVAGINLMVHVLRFDRIEISSPNQAKPAGIPSE